MPLEYTKAALTVGWIATLCVVALLLDMTSTGARLALAGIGLVPPLAMLLFWHGPSQTMSESIQRARQ